jgi:hypothetical protein
MILFLVKNGKFGNSQAYLKKNPYQRAKISFRLLENKTKKVKAETSSSNFLLKEKLILLNDEIIIM